MRSWAVILSAISLGLLSRRVRGADETNATDPFGRPCLQAHSKLAFGTFQLSTECDSAYYCAANSTCAHKGCRRDTYPFGYSPEAYLPPKCGEGQFCPDEGDMCLPILPVDSACQLNRDDQCALPPNSKELAGPRNNNGALCLNFQCMWANATLGNKCIVENTPYVVYDQSGGKEFVEVVSRDNCKTGLWCDATKRLCAALKDVGAACEADKECSTTNCGMDGKCGIATNTTVHVQTYVYVVIAAALIGGILAILATLFFVHQKSRKKIAEKRAQYWREQEAYRQNILSMREQARLSTHSLPRQTSSGDIGRDSDYASFDQSKGGAFYATPQRSSGLRNNYSDSKDGDSMEESLVHHYRDEDDADYERRRLRKPSRV